MTPELFQRIALVPALSLLPPAMDTPAARAFILAICLQESGLTARRQRDGPARGLAQFEKAGVNGVLTHAASSTHAKAICAALSIQATTTSVHAALQYADVLTAVFARLLLWTLPQALPAREDSSGAWSQYLSAWRPGKPHRETWATHYAHGWAVVEP